MITICLGKIPGNSAAVQTHQKQNIMQYVQNTLILFTIILFSFSVEAHGSNTISECDLNSPIVITSVTVQSEDGIITGVYVEVVAGMSRTTNTIRLENIAGLNDYRRTVEIISGRQFTDSEWKEILNFPGGTWAFQPEVIVELELFNFISLEASGGFSQFSPEDMFYQFGASVKLPIIGEEQNDRFHLTLYVGMVMTHDPGFDSPYVVSLIRVGDSPEEIEEFQDLFSGFYGSENDLGPTNALQARVKALFEYMFRSNLSGTFNVQGTRDLTPKRTRPARGTFSKVNFSIGLKFAFGGGKKQSTKPRPGTSF